MKICTEIRTRRVRLHLSQFQLAKAAGVSYATVSKAERESADPVSDEITWAILEALSQLEDNPKKLEAARKIKPADEKKRKAAEQAAYHKNYAVLGLGEGWHLIGVYTKREDAEYRAGLAIRQGEYRDAFVFKETDW